MQTLLPRLSLNLSAPAPASLTDLFPLPVESVCFEIGFGAGEHLAAEAQIHPQSGFIGCDPFVNGMAKMLSRIEQDGITNVRLFLGDAVGLIDWLPDASLDQIDLLYPDPWPKRRHWKRRLIQDASIAKLARTLCPGGVVRFATDHPDYAAWTLERFGRSRTFTWVAERVEDWRQPWHGYVGTRYEAKAKREGRMSCYLVFRRGG